jgi:CheY-like chemotaxis protein
LKITINIVNRAYILHYYDEYLSMKKKIKKMKQILIVDDQSEVREVMKEFFTMRGFLVVEAFNGQNALEKFNDDHPDVAIVDIQMPVMDGVQFSEKVLEKQVDFPIIMITGYIEKYSRDDLLGIGVKDVLNKPIDLNFLQSKVQEFLH